MYVSGGGGGEREGGGGARRGGAGFQHMTTFFAFSSRSPVKLVKSTVR